MNSCDESTPASVLDTYHLDRGTRIYTRFVSCCSGRVRADFWSRRHHLARTSRATTALHHSSSEGEKEKKQRNLTKGRPQHSHETPVHVTISLIGNDDDSSQSSTETARPGPDKRHAAPSTPPVRRVTPRQPSRRSTPRWRTTNRCSHTRATSCFISAAEASPAGTTTEAGEPTPRHRLPRWWSRSATPCTLSAPTQFSTI